MKILEIQELTKEFPGVVALDSVNMDLEAGEIHSLVGENGAGKSTLVKILAGVYRPTSGHFSLKGEEMHFHSPKDASKHIGVVHQERELVPHFSGYQNLFLGLEETKAGFLKRRVMISKAREFISKYQLDVDMNLPAKQLGSGQQEMLTILKVLFRDPKIVVFDEPTAPLSIKEIEILFKLIKDLRGKGMTVLYISHHLSEVLELSDRITVLRNGKKVSTIENGDQVSERKLISLMISKDLENQYPKTKTEIGKEVFSVKDYSSSRSKFSNISFSIREGEIVGFAGLVGAGRTELAKAIFSGVKYESGEITLNGNRFISKSSGQSVRKGIAMIPENRRAEGLFVQMSVKENLVVPHLSSLSKMGFTVRKDVKEYVGKAIKRFSIKVTSPEQSVRTLSGGNQQKVSVGKWMGENAAVWIFDEPTQGIDVDAKTEIYNIMGSLAKGGAGIWFISSDLRELVAISDRIYVMKGFKILGEFVPPFDEEEILALMIGEKKS